MHTLRRAQRSAALTVSSAPLSTFLENGRIEIGKRRGEQLAKAFNVHPAIIVFPEYEAQYRHTAA